jgi:hypothetical protein
LNIKRKKTKFVLFECVATEYVPWVGDLFVSGFLAGAASVRCSSWSLDNVQTFEPCYLLFRQQPLLLVCSTPLHKGQQVYEEFHLSWKAILQRHQIIIKTTTTLMNNTYLTNATHIQPTTTSTKKIKLVKEYQIHRTSTILFSNISNQTISMTTNKLNLTNDNQEKIIEKSPLHNSTHKTKQ